MAPTTHDDFSDERHSSKSVAHSAPIRSKLMDRMEEALLNLTPAFFSLNMGTGIVSILLYDFPFNAHWLRTLAIVIFVFNVVLFFVLLLANIARFVIWKGLFAATLAHPVASMFWGTFPMGLITIVNMIALVCVPDGGLSWARLALGLWWIDIILSVVINLGIVYLMFTRQTHTPQSMAATWLLPIVSCVVAAASGAVVSNAIMPLLPHLARSTTIVAYIIWGTGVPLAMFVITIFLHRTIVHGLPAPANLTTLYLPLGPCGQASFGMALLGRTVRKLAYEYDVGLTIAPPGTLSGEAVSRSMRSVAEAVYAAGIITSLVLWGLGFCWYLFATASLIDHWWNTDRSYFGRQSFSVGFTALTFPIGVWATASTALATELDSWAFRIIGAVVSLQVVFNWSYVITFALYKAYDRTIFVAPELGQFPKKTPPLRWGSRNARRNKEMMKDEGASDRTAYNDSSLAVSLLVSNSSATATVPTVAGNTVMTATMVLASAAATTAVNTTQVIASEKADQTATNSAMPGVIYLVAGGLLIFCMALGHTRFLARLFASFPPTKSQWPSSNSSDVLKITTAPNTSPRAVGGDDLKTGWFFSKGSDRHIEIFSPCTPATGKTTGLYLPQDTKPSAFPTAARPRLSPPPHIVPLLHYVPCSSSLISMPFYRLPSYFKSLASMPAIYIAIGYLLCSTFALVWKSRLAEATADSGYGSDFKRSGLVGIAQLPLVVALGVRGNVIGLCVGQGYEKLKFYHKIVGRVFFAAATVHSVGYMYTWASAGVLAAKSAQSFAIYGYLAFGALILITLSSLPFIRQKCFRLFKFCHFIGMVSTLVGLAWHVDTAVPYCIAALAFYLVSALCSLTKTRLATAQLHAVPSAESTIITIPELRSGWRAGQHVRIRIPSLGLRQGSEAHPFTIASAPNGEGLVLICKRAGDWTMSLFNLAQNLRAADTESQQSQGVTVILEGPYGGLGNTMASSFSSVVVVSGGSAITHALALAHDLVLRAPTGAVRARTVDLIWMVRTEQEAKPLVSTLTELVDDARAWETTCLGAMKRDEAYIPPTALRVKICITRCPASSPITLISDAQGDIEKLDTEISTADQEKMSYLARNPSAASTITYKFRKNQPLSSITANPARPDLGILMSSIADETIAHNGRAMANPSGMFVSACGPDALVHDTMMSVKEMEEYRATAVGGVEFEEERFSF
ncbi:hypothetical protein IAR50_000378 [Cryptococcus sp. DSM 104548]